MSADPGTVSDDAAHNPANHELLHSDPAVSANVNELANEDDADSEAEHGNNGNICIPTTTTDPPINWKYFFETFGFGHPSGPGKGLRRASFPFGLKEFGAHFWAVLIGNNKYSKPMKKLSSCINDCNLMARYLHNYLQVPPSRFTCGSPVECLP